MIESPFAKDARASLPLSEHPRPQFRRDDWLCLNGEWDFHIDQNAESPSVYETKILVPFAVETALSGVQRRVAKNDVMHYRRFFTHPLPKGKRAILHFDAVDQVCEVRFNGVLLGSHEGGYLPFQFDVSEFYAEENEIRVEVKDDVKSPIYPRGKQSAHPQGIWYTPTSGIHQTCWIEFVPETGIDSFRLTPNLASSSLAIRLSFRGEPMPVKIEAKREGKLIVSKTLLEGDELTLSLPEPVDLWSPEHPSLYELEIVAGEDHIHSYFAMREFGKTMRNGHPVFSLNGKPYFLSGILDQGYFPESGLTPPSEEAMLFDLRLLKDYGFNMVRKHIKREPYRWYALCDRLGLVVFQDFINGGAKYSPFLFATGTFLQPKWKDDKSSFHRRVGRKDQASRSFFEREFPLFVDALQNVPSLAAWVIFNEAWGQFDSGRFLTKLRELDPTRLVDAVSGWCDQGEGDFSSHHLYFRKARMKPDPERILFLSEFGGYSWHIPEHSWNDKVFGYKRFSSKEALQEALEKLYLQEIKPLREKVGLAALVYTQLSDVEAETNGLVTYDRKVVKIDAQKMNEWNKELAYDD